MEKPRALIRSYLTERVTRGELATSSAYVIERTLRQWCEHAGPRPRTWSTDQVASWVNDPMLRATTRKSRLTKLRPFIAWLIDQGHLENDPTSGIGRIRVPSGAPRDLTADEVRQLLRACPDARARLIVILMAQMGLRCGDVARIRVEDIDTQRRLLHVRAKGGGGEPTHWEPIPSEAWAALRSYVLDRRKVSGPLIRSRQRPGTPLTPGTISKLVRTWMTEAGLKEMPWDGRSAHALRHSCAQHIIDAGADLRVVQHVLGHRSIRSTELYVRREPPGLRDAMEGRRYLVGAA